MTLNFIKSNKAKSNLKIATLATMLLLIGLNFQNCSKVGSSDFGDSASGGVSGIEGIDIVSPDSDTGDDPVDGGGLTTIDEPGSVTAEFSAGDRYQGQVLVSTNSFLDTMLNTFNYSSYGFSKAIAVAENGLGYMSMSDVNNPNEAVRMALESCNLLANLPCAVIVSDNVFVIDSSDISNHLEYVINDLNGTSFNRSAIPMTTDSVRNSTLVSNYISADVEKAMAISVTGGVYVTYTYSYILSQQEVERMAVQQCEMQSAISPCILYAVNNSVVFDPDDWVKRTQLIYNNNNVMAISPPASRDGALTAIRSLLDSLEDGQRYAITITPNGYGYFGVGDDVASAVTSANSSCASGVHNTRCVEYANSEGVSFSVNNIQSKINYPSLFCKSVRYSCRDHRALGCDAGTYWVQDTRSLSAELAYCN